MLEDEGEVGHEPLLEELLVGAAVVLAYRVNQVHQGQHLVGGHLRTNRWSNVSSPLQHFLVPLLVLLTHLPEALLDTGHDHGGVLGVLLGDLRQGVEDYFVVEGEGDESLLVLLCHLPRHPAQFGHGALTLSQIQQLGWSVTEPYKELDILPPCSCSYCPFSWQDGALPAVPRIRASRHRKTPSYWLGRGGEGGLDQ